MPNYDVECSDCGLQDIVSVKMIDLAEWDRSAQCPSCEGRDGAFRRVLINAPVGTGGTKATARLEIDRKQTTKDRFTSSGAKDSMLHKQAKKFDYAQASAARESVKKGEFEGF